MSIKIGCDISIWLRYVCLTLAVIVAGANAELVCESSHETYDIANNFTIKTYKEAVVSVDNEYCSNVGKDIILQGGSAVDAAISAGLCNGLMNAQSSGIGGGFFMTIYLKETRQTWAINARERASENAFETMFGNKSSIKGGLATAIPGEIAGYWEAHQIAGRLPWKALFQPAIEMCRNGYKVSAVLAKAITKHENEIRTNAALNDIFIDQTTNLTKKENDTITRPNLANTLETIAECSASTFYSGQMAANMVHEINSNGGNVTLKDFQDYNVNVSEAEAVYLDDNLTIYTTSVPSSGLVAAFIIQIMQQYDLDSSLLNNNDTKTLFYHRLIETFKFAYAHRARLGDEDTPEIRAIIENLKDKDYASNIRSMIDDTTTRPSEYYSTSAGLEDHGTAHISVISGGDAVSYTSTINTYFGAMYAGEYTGIIYNNEMDDFSNPLGSNFFGLAPSPENYPKPGKRPMSSMSPLVVVDDITGEPVLVLGASGGSKITSAVAQVAIKTLFMGMNIKDAIDDRRVHHQLYPENAYIEEGFDETVTKMLQNYGHKLECFGFGGSIIQAVHQVDGNLNGYCDPRKGGIPAGV